MVQEIGPISSHGSRPEPPPRPRNISDSTNADDPLVEARKVTPEYVGRIAELSSQIQTLQSAIRGNPELEAEAGEDVDTLRQTLAQYEVILSNIDAAGNAADAVNLPHIGADSVAGQAHGLETQRQSILELLDPESI